MARRSFVKALAALAAAQHAGIARAKCGDPASDIDALLRRAFEQADVMDRAFVNLTLRGYHKYGCASRTMPSRSRTGRLRPLSASSVSRDPAATLASKARDRQAASGAE